MNLECTRFLIKYLKPYYLSNEIFSLFKNLITLSPTLGFFENASGRFYIHQQKLLFYDVQVGYECICIPYLHQPLIQKTQMLIAAMQIVLTHSLLTLNKISRAVSYYCCKYFFRNFRAGYQEMEVFRILHRCYPFSIDCC